MKIFICIASLFIVTISNAQPLPHNMVFGKKPNAAGLVIAPKLEAFMGNRTRISVTLSGLVTLVTKNKGGWFDIDAGKGNVITAHFRNYNVTIPSNLKNHYIVAEGVASRQIIASAGQHFAGDKKSPYRQSKPAKKQIITFEVSGLRVDR